MRTVCTGYETKGRRGGIHTQPKSWNTSTAIKWDSDGKLVRATLKGDDAYITSGSSHIRIATLDLNLMHQGSTSEKTFRFALDTSNPDDVKLLMVTDESSHEFSKRYGEIKAVAVEATTHRDEGDDGHGSTSVDNSPKGKAKALVEEIWNGWGFCDPQIAELRELLSKA